MVFALIHVSLLLYKTGTQSLPLSFTVKYVRRIYGRIAGNQLPGHLLLFFKGTVKIISHGKIGKSKVVLFTAA